MSDPRVFFAAERTLLAWVRSGLAIIALGFVVARFGLFLTLLASSSVVPESFHSHGMSNLVGIILVLLGSLCMMGALHNHRVYVRSLPPEDVPKLPLPWLTSLLVLVLAIAGALMAAYLAFA